MTTPDAQRLRDAIAVLDKSAERTTPNAQTEAWTVIRAHLAELEAFRERVMGASEQIEEIAHRLEEWMRAYPVDIFPEPAEVELKWLHETKRGLCDRISASMGRHMVKHMADMAAQFRSLVPVAEGE